jgi:tetratricopeptide (TPR) repeat protein
MRIRSNLLKHYMIPEFIAAFLLCLPQSIFAYDFNTWSHGASGYNNAIEKATIERDPLILYFQTDESTWSKKMNDRYLASNDVATFLSSIPKVEINPERGADEKALAREYDVTGYPTFLVFVPSTKMKPQSINPFRQGGDWTTGEFIYAIILRLVDQYDHGGYEWFKGGQYDEAIRYFDKSVSLDPEDAYAYYMRGIIYHTIASRDGNMELLKKAEINYMKSLTIDLDQPEIIEELEKLQKAMKQKGVK